MFYAEDLWTNIERQEDKNTFFICIREEIFERKLFSNPPIFNRSEWHTLIIVLAQLKGLLIA